jgi:hypothetical protein
VDLFFLKTCDYGGAQRRLIGERQREKEGILCAIEPCARYGVKPCRGSQCHLCQSERYVFKKSSIASVVQFSDKQIHRFVNDYEAILNCPAVRCYDAFDSTATLILPRHARQQISSML